MARNEVTIEFKGKNTQLIDAIKQLDGATKSLIKTQVSLDGAGKKQRKTMTASQKAMTSLTVRLKSLGSSFAKANISTELLTKAYKGNKGAIDKARLATSKHIKELKRSNKATLLGVNNNRLLSNSLATIRSKLLLVNFALALGVRQIASFVASAGKVQSMENAFNTLTNSTGNASEFLTKLKTATNDTMDEFSLFQQANNAMVLGITKNSDEMSEMFDVAQRLGRALGKDTASSVESLITGIGRQSRLMLDNIGIVVKSEDAYRMYADKLGTTSDKLTDAQRKQAFLEATMESARNKVSQLGDETDTTQDKFDRLSASASNLAVAVGDKLSPLFSSLANRLSIVADATTDLISEDDNQLEKNKKIIEILQSRINIQNNLTSNTEDAITVQDVFAKIYDDQISVADQFNLSLEATGESLTAFGANTVSSMELLGIKHKSFTEIIKANEEDLLANLKEVRDESSVQEITDLEKRNEMYKQFYLNQMDLALQVGNSLISSFNNITGALQSELSAREQSELTSLRQTEEYKRASDGGRIAMEAKLTESFANEKLKLFNLEKASNMAQIISNTATAVMKAYSQLGAFAKPVVGLIIGAGALQLATVAKTKPPKFEEGGLVGGSRHSAGGTMIEAEQGEFVMSRRAVQTIGIEALNQINAGAGTGVTVNISAPLVDETVIDHIIPSIEKARRMNLA